ncbi:response regulator [Candidatus Clostridium stratigraminis]|uniref:Stage 0 sporulation protein A homolog n=1 Tax=Candidatus Clostridium stratigraminis TaxID=3381661 RepID=A0ABW8T6K9_9CLOT
MKKVLVVDDSSFMRLSIKMSLEKNEFEVVGEAVNGLEAVNKYKELHPDIVTMDITMPEMEGLDALALILQFDPNAKVVMLSALGQESKVKTAILNGAKSFVVKPYKEEHLVKVLSQV